jgi:hypothetical protein
MLNSIKMGWYLLRKYYRRSDECPAYAASILLNPRQRIAYLEKNWQADWIEPAIVAANTIWENDYKDRLPVEPERIPDIMPPPSSGMRPRNELDKLRNSVSVEISVSTDGDNFKSFIQGQPIAINQQMTPLQWWCQAEQRQRYPRLHQMAIDILSIPSESAEAERTFSGARRTCRWDRLALSCRRIEIVECIGNWFREGFLDGIVCASDIDIDDFVDIDQSLDPEAVSDDDLELLVY